MLSAMPYLSSTSLSYWYRPEVPEHCCTRGKGGEGGGEGGAGDEASAWGTGLRAGAEGLGAPEGGQWAVGG